MWSEGLPPGAQAPGIPPRHPQKRAMRMGMRTRRRQRTDHGHGPITAADRPRQAARPAASPARCRPAGPRKTGNAQRQSPQAAEEHAEPPALRHGPTWTICRQRAQEGPGSPQDDQQRRHRTPTTDRGRPAEISRTAAGRGNGVHNLNR